MYWPLGAAQSGEWTGRRLVRDTLGALTSRQSQGPKLKHSGIQNQAVGAALCNPRARAQRPDKRGCSRLPVQKGPVIVQGQGPDNSLDPSACYPLWGLPRGTLLFSLLLGLLPLPLACMLGKAHYS